MEFEFDGPANAGGLKLSLLIDVVAMAKVSFVDTGNELAIR
jgi:hypothetical protein